MKRGGPSHPKTYALAEALGVRRVHAVGLLELLFHFTAQYAPAGDVGRYTDKRIAAALDWCGSVSKLIDSLVDSRWLDRHPVARLVLHDWADHADRTTLQKLNRSGKKPIQSPQEDTTNLCTQTETSGFNIGALPEPEPVPAPGSVPALRTQPESAQKDLRARRMPIAMDEHGDVSPGFEQWWDRWCELTNRAQRKVQAGHAWVSVARVKHEQAIADCLERYGMSDEVFRGVVSNPDKWLFEQAENNFAGTWPPRRTASNESRQQRNADAWGTA
jgi:hypothetical protein